jgi:hypothetical protein
LKLTAQGTGTANFIGINPSVTIEPYYEKGELDINIFPFVFQKTITKRVDVRLSTIVNYGVRNNGNAISHLGFQTGFPIYILAKEDLSQSSKGIYFEPGFGVTRNFIEKHNNIGLWLEPGYQLAITENWSISFGAQVGATLFLYDDGKTDLKNHFGIKVIIGKWF